MRGSRRYAVLAAFHGRVTVVGSFASDVSAERWRARFQDHADRRGPYPELRVWVKPLNPTGTGLHAVLDFLTA